jgi:hypothetical protein
MDFIRPIGSEHDVDPLARVQRLKDEQREREQQQREEPRKRPPAPEPATAAEVEPEGPVEGDDGHLHIDIRA